MTRELFRGLYHFGVQTLTLALGVGMLSGGLVVVQTTLYVQRFGARGFLGFAAGYAVVWEFGPLVLGLLLVARCGARNAAELATLAVGGQLEGLEGISIDPDRLLVVPRVVALTASALLLSGLTWAVAILFAAGAAQVIHQLPVRAFLENLALMLSAADLGAGMFKVTAFGFATALLSSAAGLSARGDARAVGRATARAVSASTAAIFALDLGITLLLRGGAR